MISIIMKFSSILFSSSKHPNLIRISIVFILKNLCIHHSFSVLYIDCLSAKWSEKVSLDAIVLFMSFSYWNQLPPFIRLILLWREKDFGSIVDFAIFNFHKSIGFGLDDFKESIGESVEVKFLVLISCVFPKACIEFFRWIIVLWAIENISSVHSCVNRVQGVGFEIDLVEHILWWLPFKVRIITNYNLQF